MGKGPPSLSGEKTEALVDPIRNSSKYKVFALFLKEKSASDPDNPELVLGRMRCYESLGEWGDLHAIAERHWPVASDETKHRMARMAASASWGRQEWEAMAR